ncbi:odorant receptor 85b-like [Glossina fuscipes]|uniref:Odorant receptor n=1 Tax=Glossina fuscipes TaxID=7396 RepID=A0A9C5ZJA3_9MUSC|nr:odorant receptor 85b-like [Glossina fuscipes]
MKLYKFEDFVRLANLFYTSLGIEPYALGQSTKWQILFRYLIFYFQIINLSSMVVCEVTYVFLAFRNDNNFLEATMIMSYIGFVLVGIFKMLSIWRQRSLLTTFVQELLHIFPETPEQQRLYNLDIYVRQCTRVTVCFSLLYMLLIWTYNLFAILQYVIYERWLKWRVVGKQLPYTMYILWNWHDHWSYYPLYALECIAGFTSAAGQISCDLLLCAFATQLIMHYDYVSRSLAMYEVKFRQKFTEPRKAMAEDMKFLRKIIAYHANVLSLSELMNKVFGVALFFNFMASSFVICFVGFQMTMGADPDTLFKLFLFLFTSASQVYLISHYGQQLIDASFNIATAVYNQQWYNADIGYKKMLVLIATRAQKPVELQATKFVLISRGTMTDIMQLSYKFFALLRTIYAE